MISRLLYEPLAQSLAEVPAVCLLGPRQVGKTTLALAVGASPPALYLDLESEQDRARLTEAEYYLGRHLDRLVILDEVQRMPGLFPVLRGLIDRSRRSGAAPGGGAAPGRYLLLGSASPELLRQSGESLAGRIRYLELTPFSILEPADRPLDLHWLRGGFPESLLAADDARSLRWRQDFIRTYLERDIPQFGPRIAAQTLRRFWTMLAYNQGTLFNAAALARNLGLDSKTIARYMDLLVDLFLVRRLLPWYENLGKRLVRSPRIYVRDSGLLHALLTLGDLEHLLVHPVLGASWEGFVIENLLANATDTVVPYFYRTTGGAEIDLLLVFADGTRWAVEIKRSFRPRPERGFHAACADVAPARRFIVYPGDERYLVGADVEAIPLAALAAEVARHAVQ